MQLNSPAFPRPSMKVTSLIKNKTPSSLKKRICGLSIDSFSASKEVSLNSGCFEDKYSFDRDNFKGTGSSASVFACNPILTGTDVKPKKMVVKVYDTKDEGNIEAARNEVTILQKLPHHPNVV